jgi:hypothetical protein
VLFPCIVAKATAKLPLGFAPATISPQMPHSSSRCFNPHALLIKIQISHSATIYNIHPKVLKISIIRGSFK